MASKNVHDMAVELSFEALDFRKQMSTLQQEIRNVEKNFKNAGKTVDDFERTFQGLDAKMQKTSRQIDLYNTKLSKQQEEYNELKGVLDKQIVKLKELEETQGRGSKEWQTQAELVQKNSKRLNQLGTDINSSKSNINKLGKELEKSQKEFDDLSKAAKTADQRLLEISKEAKLSESEFNKLVAELEESGNSFEKLANTVNKVSSEIMINSKRVDVYKDEINKLNGTLDKSKKEHSELTSKIDIYEKQLSRCISVYGENSNQAEKYKKKLLQLKDEHRELEQEIDSTTNSLNDYKTELNNAQANVTKLSNELRTIPFKTMADDLKNAGQKLDSLGSSFTRNVTVPITAITGLASKFAMDFEEVMAKVGTIADTTKVPIQELKEEVVDLSDKTGQSTNDLGEAMYQAISASVDTAEAIDFLDLSVKAAVGGFSTTTTAVEGLTTVLNSYGLETKEAETIANQMLITQNKGKTTFDELASSVGKVTPLASALGLETKELFSSLAVTTAQGLATTESVSGLKAAFSNIIKPTKEAQNASKALGIEFSVAALNSKGWIKFLSDVKTGLENASPEFESISKQFENNSKKLADLESQGKKTSQEYKTLAKENKNLSGELEILAQSSDSPVSAMSTLFGSVEGLNAMLMLTSEQGMTMYSDTMNEMQTNTTALDDAYNQMAETTSFKFKKALNESKNAVMELGVKLLPTINQAIELLGRLVDKFNDLSPAQQETIIQLGLMFAVVGPLLSGIGKMTSGIGTLVDIGGKAGTMFGKLSGKGKIAAEVTEEVAKSATKAGGMAGLGGLVSSLGKAALASAPYIAAVGGVALAGYGVYKTLDKDVIPSVDLFADKLVYASDTMGNYASSVVSDTITISEATQQAVTSFIDMSNGVTDSLTSLYINSQIITDETCNQMFQKYQQMGQTITTSLEQDKINDVAILTTFFNTSTVLTEEQEAETLRLTQEGYDSKKVTIEETQAKILEILNTAKENSRALTETEMIEIGELQNQMKTQAIKTLSEQEAEANVILDRMAAYDSRVTAEQATKHIESLNEQRDKAIDSANTEYREVTSTITRMRDELKVISEEQANTMIQDAERQRDDVIKAAKDTRDGAVSKIFEMNTELANSVDSSSGKIVSTWDKLFGKWDKWDPKKKTVMVETSYTSKGTPPVSGGIYKQQSYMHDMANYISRGVEAYNVNYMYRTPSVNIQEGVSKFDIPVQRYKLSGGYYTGSNVESVIKSDTKNIGSDDLYKKITDILSNPKTDSGTYIFKIDLGLEAMELTYKKIGNEFALASKRRR